ncbi:dual specificity protein phosphatase family protein [Aquimarina algicola]|uniref:Protein tyrosine phosphatase n=1 Tax=Aquimarina algicola TaxID=2589995 RepID=A0A504JJG2_9FLAO|nr:dual specificity protein phosphatase family protein [Aquimarina algicola]TPN88912.1 protein tyrosine phosphatase [Aquimarina algicola]
MSEQPSKKEFYRLEDFGIKTILNFRRLKDDAKKAKGTQLQLEHLPLKAAEINEKDIITGLQIINTAQKPILIHCWHGSDRTGVMTAAYRIVFENWSKEDAIKEFRRPEFGYHEKWYPNLVDLLNDLDVTKIRDELGL